MKLWVLPIEPLEERYSAQWLQWTREFLAQNVSNCEIINPPSYEKIEHGAFLDASGTCEYKSQQLAEMCKNIHSGRVGPTDVIWVQDGWFPGIESLAYVRACVGIPFTIYAMFHAGTYDPNDYLCRTDIIQWGHLAEHLWCHVYDGIFVATKYHRNLLNSTIGKMYGPQLSSKIHVTGFPLQLPQRTILPRPNREKIVVFPHRLDPEKCPNNFNVLKELAQAHPVFKDYTFVRTKDVCTTKAEYYALLSKAEFAVSFAKQETWGIAMQEATFYGCVPIVPDRLSYTEMYADECRYTQFRGSAVEATLCLRCMHDWLVLSWQEQLKILQSHRKLFIKGYSAFSKMIEKMDVWHLKQHQNVYMLNAVKALDHWMC